MKPRLGGVFSKEYWKWNTTVNNDLSQKRTDTAYQELKKMFTVLFILIAIVILAYVFNFRHSPISKSPEAWGQLGDYFGGTINPIISLCALIGLLVSIVIQREALSNSREELKNSREELKKNSEALSQQATYIRKDAAIADAKSSIWHMEKVIDSILSRIMHVRSANDKLTLANLILKDQKHIDHSFPLYTFDDLLRLHENQKLNIAHYPTKIIDDFKDLKEALLLLSKFLYQYSLNSETAVFTIIFKVKYQLIVNSMVENGYMENNKDCDFLLEIPELPSPY